MPDPTVIEVLVSASTVIEVLVPGPQGPANEEGGGTAATVTYDNDVSGLVGDNVQEALDELAGDIPAQALGAGASPTFAGLTLSALAAAGILVAGIGGALGAVPGQIANTFYVGPGSGAAAAPTFRAMVIADIPFAGQANGLATLDSGGKIPAAQLSALAITETFVVASQAAMLALTAERGDVAVRTDLSKSFILSTDSPGTLADWKELLTPTDAVLSVAGLTGSISAPDLKSALTLAAGDVSGLGTAATVNIGTSGATVPLLDGINTWSAQNTFAAGSLGASAPHTWTQTWTGGGTFTGLLFNATDTSSAAASILLDLQRDGTSLFAFKKTAFLLRQYGADSQAVIGIGSGGYGTLQFGGPSYGVGLAAVRSDENFAIRPGGAFSWASSDNPAGATLDLKLYRDAANILAQRNGTAAQTLYLYNTYTDASNWERAVFSWGTTTNWLTIGTQFGGTGSGRSINLVGASAIQFTTGVSARWSITSSGHFTAVTDNLHDIGASGSGRPRSVYVAASINAGTSVNVGTNLNLPTGGLLLWSGKGGFAANADGVFQIFKNGIASASSIKAAAAGVIQARLWDDSDFCVFQGKLRAHANAVAETPTATHTLRYFDAAGTEYKVLAIAA